MGKSSSKMWSSKGTIVINLKLKEVAFIDAQGGRRGLEFDSAHLAVLKMLKWNLGDCIGGSLDENGVKANSRSINGRNKFWSTNASKGFGRREHYSDDEQVSKVPEEYLEDSSARIWGSPGTAERDNTLRDLAAFLDQAGWGTHTIPPEISHALLALDEKFGAFIA